jgi:hypothetical protein
VALTVEYVGIRIKKVGSPPAGSWTIDILEGDTTDPNAASLKAQTSFTTAGVTATATDYALAVGVPFDMDPEKYYFVHPWGSSVFLDSSNRFSFFGEAAWYEASSAGPLTSGSGGYLSANFQDEFNNIVLELGPALTGTEWTGYYNDAGASTNGYKLDLLLHGDKEPFGAGWGTVSDNMYAQLLRTDSSGIVLQRIDYRVGRWDSTPGVVGNMQTQLWTDDGGEPGTLIQTIKTSANIVDTGFKDYTWQIAYDNSTGIELAANTDYWITVEATGGQFGTVQWDGPTVVTDVSYLANYTSKWYFSTNDGSSWSVGPDDQMCFRFFGKQSEATPPEKAINPTYEDGFSGAANGVAVALTWEDGGSGPTAATAYDVYLGTSFEGPVTKVAEDITNEFYLVPQDIQQQLGKMPSSYFEALTEYEWYIVSKNDDGDTTGDTWSFTTNAVRGLGAPHTPTPETAATGQSITITGFSWLGGEGSLQNTVYMGQTSGQLQPQFTLGGSGLANNVNPSTYRFEYGQTTYWRVEATNGLGTVSGAEWSMTFLTLGDGAGGDIIITPAGPWGAGGAPTRRLAIMLTNKGVWYEDLL